MSVNKKGFQPKQMKVFTEEEIARFLRMKCWEYILREQVAMILGFLGRLRNNDQTNLNHERIILLNGLFVSNLVKSDQIWSNLLIHQHLSEL